MCKICGELVAEKRFRQHIRDKHHDSICKKILPHLFWSPEQTEKLVRIVDQFNRQNKETKYLKGLKAFNWARIADQMNLSNEFKLSPKQIRNKWDNIVTRLTKVPIEEKREHEQAEKNGYVFLIKIYCI